MAQHHSMHRLKDRVSGAGFAKVLVLAFVAPVVAAAMALPAAGQQEWAPTVATVPGGTLNGPLPGALNREPTRIDPRYFPSPHKTTPPVRNPVPQGAWSPIVTGALPRGDGRTPPQGNAARPGAGAVVAPLDSLSPVRPNNQAATSGGAKLAAEKTGAEAAQTNADGEATDSPMFKKPGPLDALPPNASAAQQYCFNTADSAADARFAWQAKKIKDMEDALDKKARQLEAKTEAYKHWLDRRDEFSRKAHEKLVGFYSRMRADAAAVQLAALNEEMAAAVVMKLQTKVASQIMGEMDPERAAKIATIISGAAKVPRDKRSAASAAAAAPPPNDESSEPPDAEPAPGGT